MTTDEQSITEDGLESLAPEELMRALGEAFNAHGDELYLVGGAVRETLLGQPLTDLDFATSARPPRTAEILQERLGRRPYRIGEKFGTVGVRYRDQVVEITTYRRTERYAPGSRRPEVVFGQSLFEDIARRDFTVNAIALDPLSGEIIDPLGGRQDLRDRIIRAVGDPAERFREDPLRILRAIRFSGRLGFTIEPVTWTRLVAAAPELRAISRERIRDEYSKVLTAPDPVRGLTLLRDGGLFEHTVPELIELTLMPDHGPRHPLSLWDHVMRVVQLVPDGLIVRWAALLHDIAKPRTRTHEPSGRPRFFHHEEVGAVVAREVLSSLRYPNSVVDAVALLIATHMQLHSYNPTWTDGAVRRLMLRLGAVTEDAIALARADGAGHALYGAPESSPKFDHLEARIHALSREHVEALASPLTGDDLMERYNRSPGPWIRRIKDRLRDEVVEGHLAPGDRDAAWAIADRMVVTGEAK